MKTSTSNVSPWTVISTIIEPSLLSDTDGAAEREAEDIFTCSIDNRWSIEELFRESIKLYKRGNSAHSQLSILTSFYLLRLAGYLRETLGEEGDPGDWLEKAVTEAEILLRDTHSLTEDDLLKMGGISSSEFHLRHHKVVHETATAVGTIH